jgi:hypothetical protein
MYYLIDVLGINFLPSILENSNSSSRITNSNVVEHGNGKFETIISVNSKFIPGSIVIYKTSVYRRNEDVIFIPFQETILLSPNSDNVFDQLRASLGMDSRNGAIRVMVHLGYNFINTDLWYPSVDSIWPPGLLECINDFGYAEINLVMFRSSQEEKETFG